MNDIVERPKEAFTKTQELRSFLFLSVVMAPVLAGRHRRRLRLPRLDVSSFSPARRAAELTRSTRVAPPSTLQAEAAVPEEVHISSLVVHADAEARAARRGGDRRDARRAGARAVRPTASWSSRSKPAAPTRCCRRVDQHPAHRRRAVAPRWSTSAPTPLEAMNEEIPDADRLDGTSSGRPRRPLRARWPAFRCRALRRRRRRARTRRAQVVQGAVPLLRHRLRRDGRR